MNLLLGVIRPGRVVKLCDVVNNIFKATEAYFTTTLLNHAVKRAKNICLEHVSVSLTEGGFLALLLIRDANVLFVLRLEWFMTISGTV